MKKYVVLAALASLLVAVGVSSTLAAAAVTSANGTEVILPDGNVYQQNADGTYSLIPDVATANAMRLDWNALESVGELPGPAGEPLPSVVELTNARVTVSNAATRSPITPANGSEVILPDGNVGRHLLADPGRRHRERDAPRLERARVGRRAPRPRRRPAPERQRLEPGVHDGQAVDPGVRTSSAPPGRQSADQYSGLEVLKRG
jgi:hypothetical protein